MESLAVKYRPKSFDYVVGQSSIINILSRQVNSNNIKNAYIFSGASGCGKTTCARIFANEINHNLGTPIEIDAASNNGVDKIRELVQTANQRSLDSEYKVIILDEAHTLTSQSWQALLKVLEEPPKYTIFIFCTTDPQKIPATIVNRCQRYNFGKIPAESIRNNLRYICRQEHFSNYEDTIKYISNISHNQMRDAIANLEKVADYNTSFDMATTLMILGGWSYDSLFELLNGVIDGDEATVLNRLTYFYESGKDLKLFIDEWIKFLMDILKYFLFKQTDILSIPDSMVESLNYVIGLEDAGTYYYYLLNKSLELKNTVKQDTELLSTVQIFFLNMCRGA